MSKPWLRQQTNVSSSGELFGNLAKQQSGLENTANDPALAEQTAMANVEALKNAEAANPGTNTSTSLAGTSGLAGTTGLGADLGSSYSGLGGLGGMGGMGGMYGGMGGFGGMGMYGGYGMGLGMGMNQDSQIMQAMQMMQSLSMVVSGMTQVVGSVEQNAQGIAFLWQGLKSIASSGYDWIKNCGSGIKLKFFLAIEKLMTLVGLLKKTSEEEKGVFFLNVEDELNHKRLLEIKRRKKVYKKLFWVILWLLLISGAYLYKIGRSFKPDYLKTAIATIASGEQTKTASGVATDQLDYLFNN